MDIDTTPPFAPQPPDSAPAPSGRRWPRRVAAVAGVAALSAAAIGFGTAAAQTEDGSDDGPDGAAAVVHSGVVSAVPIGDGDLTEFDQCLDEALPDDEFMIEELPLTPPAEGDEGPLPPPEELDALDAEIDAALEQCEALLSDEERAEMARWDDFEACLDEALGDEVLGLEEIDPGAEPDPAVFEELDARFEAAEAECREQLPEDLQAEMDAWDDFDECVDAEFDELAPEELDA